jgi:hypothetical protein
MLPCGLSFAFTVGLASDSARTEATTVDARKSLIFGLLFEPDVARAASHG